MLLVLLTLLSLFLYWRIPEKYQWEFLLFSSLCILLYWSPLASIWTLLISLLVWFLVQKNRNLTVFLLFVQLILAKIFLQAIPLGLSFSSFCLLHYCFEAKSNKKTAHSWREFFTYVYFFPIFSAGPIERFEHFLTQREKKPLWQKGLTRIMFGLIKKWLIAELLIQTLLQGWTGQLLFEQGLSVSSWSIWNILWLLFIQLYFDFSGYCDLAIGVSALFGFQISENFRFPFLATNISDFWKRWHISLSSWCQRYIYLPTLGMTRNPYLAITSTFLVMGLWHNISIHWIMWSLWHACGLMFHLRWKRFSRDFAWKNSRYWNVFSVILTFVFVSTTGVFTQLDTIADIRFSFQLLFHAFGII